MKNLPKITLDYLSRIITDEPANGDLWEQYKWDFIEQFKYEDRFVPIKRGKIIGQYLRRFTLLEFLQHLEKTNQLADFFLYFEKAKNAIKKF